MKFEMIMPKMGESITDGTIIKWLKNVGDVVDKDETILEISTDKVDSEIPAPVSGKILELLAQENETVDVGSTIALIETKDKVAVKDAAKEVVVKETAEREIKTSETINLKKDSQTQDTRFYSPVVMNIANQNGIQFDELQAIPGTGINGRVTKKDIVKYLESDRSTAQKTVSSFQPSGVMTGEGIEIIEMDHIRKKIAAHMVESKRTSAHVSLYAEIDMSAITKIRERNKASFQAKEGFNLTYMPFIADATIRAVKEFPMLNASIENDKILIKHFVNLGIAVAVDYGLIVPNLFKADEKNLVGLARGINDLALRARTKKLKPDEISGGTFSISNFGVYGTTIGFPIINQPQVAILGVGAIKKRPVVINDAIAIRPILYISLTIDHRIIDGAMGAQFLQRIEQLLENFDPNMTL